MRLEAGKLYALDGQPYRCTMVNWCRARLVPNWKETTTIVAADGTARSFSHVPSRGLDVSPNSCIDEWGGD